jgi:hypothetical protein
MNFEPWIKLLKKSSNLLTHERSRFEPEITFRLLIYAERCDLNWIARTIWMIPYTSANNPSNHTIDKMLDPRDARVGLHHPGGKRVE